MISVSLVTLSLAFSLACAPKLPFPTPTPVPPGTPAPERIPIRTPPATPLQRLGETLTTRQKQQAIGAIVRKPEVVEATITQEGEQLTLRLVVTPETTAGKARELGDSFVRLVKSFGPEPNPGRDIGSGIYDYIITIAYADDTVVARGAKEPQSLNITW